MVDLHLEDLWPSHCLASACCRLWSAADHACRNRYSIVGHSENTCYRSSRLGAIVGHSRGFRDSRRRWASWSTGRCFQRSPYHAICDEANRTSGVEWPLLWPLGSRWQRTAWLFPAIPRRKGDVSSAWVGNPRRGSGALLAEEQGVRTGLRSSEEQEQGRTKGLAEGGRGFKLSSQQCEPARAWQEGISSDKHVQANSRPRQVQ